MENRKYRILGITLIIAALGVLFWLNFDSAKTQDFNQNQEEEVRLPDIFSTDPDPFTIEALKAREYLASDLVVEQTLSAPAAYKKYIVSYMSDGLKLRALMTIPTLEKPEGGFPAIILNHGYIPPAEYSTVNSYPSFPDYYSRRGYIVLKPDYRGHDDSEGDPTTIHTSEAYVVDVLNLLSSAKKHSDVNPNRIGMWGHSMGGGITLRCIVISKDIKASVLFAGVVSSPQGLYEFYQAHKDDPKTEGWIKSNGKLIEEFFGDPAENPDLWSSISPYTYLKDVVGPVQIHHGTADTSVPLEFSNEIESALKENGKTVEYFVYPGGDHNLAGSARTTFLQRTLEFFNNNL